MRKITSYVLFILILLNVNYAFASQTYVSSKDVLPKHPRLLMTKADEKVLKQNLAADALWNSYHLKLLNAADAVLEMSELKYEKKGKRLLDVSRKAFYRIFVLSYSYRMTSDKRYLDKCKREMLAVCNFTDWNPSHFLDVAEMSTGLAIGYDWLYHDLDKKTKKIIRNSLLKKGIEPSLIPENNFWLERLNNWNQVCNTGMLYASLAVFESNPALSAQIINRSINSISEAMQMYSPGGAYPEGYGYWHYGTTFNVMFIDALEKNYKNDFELAAMPGFMKSPKYVQHMLGVTMKPYNYGDMDPKSRLNVATFWFANKTKDYSLLWNEIIQLQDEEIIASFRHERFIPLMFLWGSSIKHDLVKEPAEKSFFSQGVAPVWLARTGWDENDMYVGFKTGTPSSGHAHMDIGSFIFEALGERWAIELGANDYTNLELQNLNIWNMEADSDRWKVYRYNNLAHNTLTINDKFQAVSGYAKIDNQIQLENFEGISTDMTSLYSESVGAVYRTLGFVENKHLLIADRISTKESAVNVKWRMLTEAKPIVVNDSLIELTQNGKKLQVRWKGGQKALAGIISAQPSNEYEDKNEGVSIVNFEVNLPEKSTSVLMVELIPEW